MSRGTGFERDENLIISVSARARRFFSFSRRRSFFFPLVPRYRPYFRYFRTDLLLPVVRFFLFLLCRSARERCPEDGTCQQRLLSRAFFGKFFFFFNNFHSPRRSGEACNVCEAMQERDTILDYEEFASVLQIHRRPLFFFVFVFVRTHNQLLKTRDECARARREWERGTKHLRGAGPRRNVVGKRRVRCAEPFATYKHWRRKKRVVARGKLPLWKKKMILIRDPDRFSRSRMRKSADLCWIRSRWHLPSFSRTWLFEKYHLKCSGIVYVRSTKSIFITIFFFLLLFKCILYGWCDMTHDGFHKNRIKFNFHYENGNQ